jgi:hypothetical protein
MHHLMRHRIHMQCGVPRQYNTIVA